MPSPRASVLHKKSTEHVPLSFIAANQQGLRALTNTEHSAWVAAAGIRANTGGGIRGNDQGWPRCALSNEALGAFDRPEPRSPALECQKRGRWISHKSVVRYEKAARLQAWWHQLALTTRGTLEQCERDIAGFIYGGKKPPAGCQRRRTLRPVRARAVLLVGPVLPSRRGLGIQDPRV